MKGVRNMGKDSKAVPGAFKQTWDLFEIGAIHMLTADSDQGSYEPDEIVINEDFRYQTRNAQGELVNKKVGVARYNDLDRLPPTELLQPYVRRDFKESFVKMKRLVFNKIKEENEDDESN